MTRFQDGPAAAQTLTLKRSPFLLRVTQDGQSFDALDRLEDEPFDQEKIFAYYLIDGPLVVHLKIAKPGRSGFYNMATYKLVPDQPADEDMRTQARWVAWCAANAEKLGWRKTP